ncbi:MAG: heterodisulfide reductase subunit A [Candidatus Schekmanbacteria bacterium RBG_13_48_7]|uniref:Heterodisulfide reductase subunit A n=1 Tax=Candidatus Schekmanbacteria bacterium RBG_13_48_7 TaxID=1817878 RepID=A0A1F7S039_9BACT|nr:MAG: heterodisulfide reductase subunit A [Candidatus Schekmanbacteria bacterium RBG_13_48_7]
MTEVHDVQSGREKILVIGGGISGLTASIEAAEAGFEGVLVEKNPYLGGRVARMNLYFPKLCPPTCGMEINFKRLKANSNITLYTLAEVLEITGEPGNFNVKIRQNPRFVNENCTACNACVEVCPNERPNDFNYGMDKTKAIYLPFGMAFPRHYVVDSGHCPGSECAKCVEVCKYNAIDLKMEPKMIEIKAGAVIMATGWEPYDALKIDNLGFGQYKNVITNVMMERLASPHGPTQGKILRPSDNKEVQSIAFVQCAGSRDENYLPYCSGVCCMASLKQARYVREFKPDSKVHIYYIDIRAAGKYEDFYAAVQKDENVIIQKGKVAKVTEDPATNNLIVEAENTATGEKMATAVEMVVLATGMVPASGNGQFPVNLSIDDNGFMVPEWRKTGIDAVGCVKNPVDVASSVRDATGAALHAIQHVIRR